MISTIVVIIIASFASYFLSFPLFGPLLSTLPKNLLDTYFTMYLLFNIAGALVVGLFADRIRRKVLILKCFAVLLILAVFLYYYGCYLLASAVQGFVIGAHVVIWGTILARYVKPWRRAKTFAIGAAIANLFLLWVQYTGYSNIFISILPLIPIFVLPEIKTEVDVNVWKIDRNILNFSLPIVIFYILGGFMYAIMEPAFREAGISVHVLFYVLIILVAGYLYDKFGRRIVSITGLFLLALSCVLFSRNMLISAYLIQSSYGLIDVFSMIIWADIAKYGSEGKHYGIGFSIIIGSLLAGYKIVKIYTPSLVDITIIALILLIIAAVSVALVKEPMVSEEEYALRVMGMKGVFR